MVDLSLKGETWYQGRAVFCRATATLIGLVVNTHTLCTLKLMGTWVYVLNRQVWGASMWTLKFMYTGVGVQQQVCDMYTKVYVCTQETSMGWDTLPYWYVCLWQIFHCHLPYCHLVSSYFHDNTGCHTLSPAVPPVQLVTCPGAVRIVIE